MTDETGTYEKQELSEEAREGLAKIEPSVKVPADGGDQADATTSGGPDPDSPSRTGAGSVADVPGTVGDAHDQDGESATPDGGENS